MLISSRTNYDNLWRFLPILKSGFLSWSVAFLFIPSLKAQDNYFKQAAPPSANAASLGKFGDIPVSYHTGVPEISVPIYSVKQGNLSVPITLRYHSSGIKVDELASWVGLGWSLDAGGVITRQVVGTPDEGGIGRNATPMSATMSGVGWYKNYGVSPLITDYCLVHPGSSIIEGTDAQGNVIYTDPRWNDCRWRNLDVAHGLADTEPDMFNFNFAGFNGKFFFDANRNPVMQPLQDLIIKPLGPVATPFDQWVMIAPDGTHYYFGGAGATEKTYFGLIGEASTNNNSYSTSSWYLTKIVNLNKTDSIMFFYQAEQYTSVSLPPHTVTVGPDPGPLSGSFVIGPGVNNVTFVDGMVVSQIITSSGLINVNFVSTTPRDDVSAYPNMGPNSSSTRLDAIEINAPNYQTKFQFSYSYFLSNNSTTYYDNKRLRLASVAEIAGTVSKPPHVFTYETGVTMPKRTSFARDHWGYYNGADNNIGLIPSFTSQLVNIGGGQFLDLGPVVLSLANRNPNETFMQANVLKTIQYPTGGTTQFVYEAHHQDVNTIVGGLRIKEIIDSDPTNPPVTRSYAYSDGILYSGQPNYVINMNNNTTYYLGQNFFGTIVNSETRPALKTTQGYHIGYTIVTVTSSAGGSSRYQYLNLSPSSSMLDYPPKPAETVLGSGQLLNETHLDQNNNLIKSTVNTYATDFTQNVNAIKIVAGQIRASAGGGELPIILSYMINTGRWMLAKKAEYLDGVTTTTFYRYSPNHNSPIQTTVLDSRGKRQDVISNYSKDNLINSCAVTGFTSCQNSYHAAIKPLFDQYVAGTSTSYESSLNGASATFLSCGTYSNYLGCVSSLGSGISAQDQIFKKMSLNNVIVPLASKRKVDGVLVSGDSTSYTLQNGPLVPLEHFELDNLTNALTRRATISFNSSERMTLFSKEKDTPISYLWTGYNSMLMTAEVKNATPDKIFYESFEGYSYSLSYISSDAKTGRNSYYGLAYSVHLPLPGTYVLTYWTKPSGGSWQFVQTIVSNDIPIGGSNILIDEVRVYPVGAQMTTYTYDPGIGVTSVTDANNQTTYYQYDGFGRLNLVKDFQGNILKEYKYNYKQ